ncbi:lariocidin family lasso peptide [Trinickia symbiotica]
MVNAFIQPSKIVSYGKFLAVILSKKSVPGDGWLGRGAKGM